MEVVGMLALIVPIAGAYGLVRTAGWWVPSVLLWAAALYLITQLDHDHPGDVGGLGALGNGILNLGAIALGLYGAILLAITYAVRRRRPS